MPSGASGGIRLTCTRYLGYGRGACHSVRFQPPKAQIGRRSTRRRPHTSTTTNVAIAPNTRLRTSSLFFIEMPVLRNSDAPFDSRGYIGRDVPRARRAEQESGNRSRSGVPASNPWRHVIRSPNTPGPTRGTGPRCGVSPGSTSLPWSPGPVESARGFFHLEGSLWPR